MKKYLNLRLVFVFCMVLSLILAHPLAVFADVKDLMISTDSNALMTLELNDEDYNISPMSSIGTVTNTIKSDYIDIVFYLVEQSGPGRIYQNNRAYKVDNRYEIKTTVLDGYRIDNMNIKLRRSDLPPSGNYMMSFDLASQFSHSYDDFDINWDKDIDNASTSSGYYQLDNKFSQSSGDIYINNILLDISNVSFMGMYFHYPSSSVVENIDFNFAINFTKTSQSGGLSIGGVVSNEDYQSGVSGSLSDLSSSVGEMSDEISGVTEAIQNLQVAMEPHYNNVLTQLHHITEQLHALWDQQFNLHHVPLMAKLGDIIDAIGNMDLEVEVNLNSLKTSIDTMSQNVQNKLQSVQDGVSNKIQESTEKVEEAVEKHGNFIIDGLKDLFIPSDDYFKSYFDDLFNYFSERFGFLSFPFDLLSRFVDLIVGTSDRDCVLTLPSFEIMGEQLLYEQSFNLTQFLEENFGFLIVAIRWGINLILLMRFVDLCGDKWNEVMIR